MREISTKYLDVGEHIIVDGVEYVAKDGTPCDGCDLHHCGRCFLVPCQDGLILKRVEKQPTYRPYNNTEEMIADYKKRFNVEVPAYVMPMIWVKNKISKERKLITGFRDKSVDLYDAGWNMYELFSRYTYLDGSPCRMKEE